MFKAIRLTALIYILITFSSYALADTPSTTGNIARARLNRVTAVLRLQPSAAGSSCLDSLQELHKTEDQFKVLQTRAKDPDLGLAIDVLETDYENSNEICGADAGRVCARGKRTAKLERACAAFTSTESSP